jgi:glutathione S-transferase
MVPLTLYYFPIPGRAEVARLLLTIGNVDFDDKRIDFPDWPQYKPKMPFGSMPVLDIDGKMIAQMAAIDRYCAAITGRLPADPLKVAEADHAYFFLEDLWQPISPVMAVVRNPESTEEQKAKAYEDLLAPGSTFRTRLSQMENLLAKREGEYIAGDEWCYADLGIFSVLSAFKSGWLQGIPTDILKDYPACKEFRNKIASLPEVAAYYKTQDDEARKTGFTADTA